MNTKSKSSVSGNHRRFIKTFFTLTALILFAFGATPARAAVKIWDGSSSSLWTNALNWSGGVAPVNGDDLVFPDGTPLNFITNNYAAIRLKSIVFTTVTGLQYTVYGNPIVASNNISSQSPGGSFNIVKLPITSGKNQIFSCDNAGAGLNFEGALGLGVTTVTDIGSGNLNFYGGISGTGGITKNGTGQIGFFGGSANTYMGTTVVNAGILRLQNTANNAAIAGPLIIGDGIGGSEADKVVIAEVRQIGNTVPVTVNSSGLLWVLPNMSDAFGTLSGSGHIRLDANTDLEVNYDNGSSTFSGTISGSGRFWKDGTGTLTLTGNNTYSGLTIVYADVPATGGTLLVNGSQSQSAVVVSNGCTLGGSGTVGNTTVDSGGKLSPGASIGKLTIRSNLVLAAGSTSFFELNRAGNTNDSVVGLTNVNYGGTLVVTNLGGTLANGDNFKLFTASSYSGAFSSLSLPPLEPGLGWTNKLLVNGSIEVLTPPPGDRFWTNLTGGNYGLSGNWLNQIVPGPADNANFTTNASYQVMWSADALAANAYFNAVSGTVTQAIGSATWTVTNNHIVGRDVGSSPTNIQVSGRLNVTNAAGTAILEARRGKFRLDAGTINADRLIVTNSTAQFTFNGGTLITRGGTISNISLVVGGLGGTPAVLDVQAGQPLNSYGFSLSIGNDTPNNRLYITNGGALQALTLVTNVIGSTAASSNNAAVVSGLGSVWTILNGLYVGQSGGSNSLLVANGGEVSTDTDIKVGLVSSNNLVVVTNGGILKCGYGYIGGSVFGKSNQVVVAGAGSLWTNYSLLSVGAGGSYNQLSVTDGGTVTVGDTLVLGANNASFSSAITLSGGNLIVTNASGTGLSDIRYGLLYMNSGWFLTDRLSVTNIRIFFSGGTLQSRNTTNNGIDPFDVGDGTAAATFELLGNGTHGFANGLSIANNALLKGNGTIIGNVTISSGGTLSPGASIGKLTVNGSLTLAGGSTSVFEVNKTTATNDTITGLTSVTYGGTLAVTNLSGTLANGDAFKLFSAGSYGGIYSSISPASPGAGLRWVTNGLTVDGTLRVASVPTTPPVIGSVKVSNGTNLVINANSGVTYEPVYLLTATNVALPIANWDYVATNYFDANGLTSITNAITSGESQRYFRLQVE